MLSALPRENPAESSWCLGWPTAANYAPSDGRTITERFSVAGDKAETIVPLGMPSLEMLRRVQALQPPLAGGESGVALDQAIKHAANALAGVKVTKTCQVKIVVLAATPAVATGLPDATGLGDTLRNRAAAEVM